MSPGAPEQIDPQTEERLGALLDRPLPRRVAAVLAPAAAHLVGGALRDHLLGRPVEDLDLTLEGDVDDPARRLAAALDARPVRLGGDRFAAWRLVGDGFRIDLGSRQGPTLRADLERRDLTINSLAVSLADRALHDPTGGLGDLARRRLRSVAAGVYSEDPLRVLRLVRFAVTLDGFAIDPPTLEMARRHADRLATVASERIREELRSTLAAGRPAAVRLLTELELYPALWLGGGEGGADEEGAAGEAERLAGAMAAAAETDPAPPIDAFAAFHALLLLNLELPSEAERRGLLERLHARGLLSNQERRRVGVLLDRRELPDSPAARRWFLHRTGELWSTAAALLAVRSGEDPAAILAELGRLAAAERESIFAPTPLLDGTEISRRAGVPPGPELGELVERLRRAQIEGRIGSRREALELVARLSRRVP